MSEADKLFEKLGYKKGICDLVSKDFSKKLAEIDCYKKVVNANRIKYIFFDTVLKGFGKRFYDADNNYIEDGYFLANELKAINKKCEELKWL